jgi:hypothetical protein
VPTSPRSVESFVNHLGKEHPANYSSGAGGEVLKMLDTEFSLPYDGIQEFRIQSRQFEGSEIKDIALQPRPAGTPSTNTEGPHPETRPTTEPKKVSTAGEPLANATGRGAGNSPTRFGE